MESLRVLVTGGAGFIGSHLVRALVRAGHVVRVLDNLSTGSLENLGDALSSVELVVGDVKSYGVVEKAVKGAGETYSRLLLLKATTVALLASIPIAVYLLLPRAYLYLWFRVRRKWVVR